MDLFRYCAEIQATRSGLTGGPWPLCRLAGRALALRTLLGLALGGGLGACSGRSTFPAEVSSVIAADGVLCDLTTKLAQGFLTVECLLAPGDDPHSFVLQPRQRAQWARARLRLINGYNLTPALNRLPGAVKVAELAVSDSIPVGIGRDPHVWHNPRHAAAMTRVVAAQLKPLLSPAQQPQLGQRAAAMEAVLEQLQLWEAVQLAHIPLGPEGLPSPIATSHRSMASFAAAYGLRELPLVDGGSESHTLRPQQLQAVLNQLKREQVRRLFPEPGPLDRDLQRISALSGVTISAIPLRADGLAKDAAGRTLGLVATLVHNTCAISEGLGGRCDRPEGDRLIQRWASLPPALLRSARL